ncbi:MAG: hypothetical protein ABIR79_21625 [Candidatus Binatia bacterium]
MRQWQRQRIRSVWLLVTVAVLASTGCAPHAVVPNWDPAAFRELDTLEFLTVGPEEGPHWSTVWLVVVDGQVYVRLGSRAAGRMQDNKTAPFVAVRIGGREYEHVRAEEVKPMIERVQAAMAEKYPTDLFVRYVTHPLTMRFAPEPGAGAP